MKATRNWTDFVLNNSVLICSLAACSIAVTIAFKPRTTEKLGLSHVERGNWQAAACSLKESVARDGGSGKAYLGLAQAHNHLEQYEDGLKYADKALKHHPSDANIWAERAAANLGKHDYKAALADAEEALTYDSHNMRASQVLSRAETMLSQAHGNMLQASHEQTQTQ